MNRVLALDARARIARGRGRDPWPALIDYLERRADRPAAAMGHPRRSRPAPIASASAARSRPMSHGRGLRCKPIIADVESFALVDARRASCVTCSRTENPELFRLAIGGYGLFGVIADGQAATDAAARSSSAWSRCVDLDELVAAVRGADRATAISTATSSSRSTRSRTTSSRAACSRATSRSTDGTPHASETQRQLA